MDMLRSCYTVDMQFDEAGDIIVPVRWYFVPDDTPSFPGPQKFGSQVWQWRGLEPLGIGERWDSERKWYNGSVPWPIKQPRLCDHVPVEWFDQGVPPNTPPLVFTPAGQAACCAPASGLFVSAKLRAFLYPPQTGGLVLKGSVRVSKVYYLQGGILPGAEVVSFPAHRVTGGVLVGGTVKPKLIYHASGGVLLSALNQPARRLRGKGGPSLSATKELMLIKVIKGGLRSGGKFEGRIKGSLKAGLRPGGKVRSILPCQPWIAPRSQDYKLYDLLDNRYWILQGWGNLGCSWIRPSAPFFHVNSFFTTAVCGAGKQMTLTFQDQFVNPLMNLLSYDAITGIGIWQVPYTAHDYQGRLFRLELPP